MVLYLSNSHYDICIIGAGASGLVSAIESSRRGLSCVVVDKNKKPGSVRFSLLPGFNFVLYALYQVFDSARRSRIL